MDVKQTGRRIKGFRKLKGYTQVEFAKRLHTSASLLSSIEQGKREPSDSMLEKLCEELNVSCRELTGVNETGPE